MGSKSFNCPSKDNPRIWMCLVKEVNLMSGEAPASETLLKYNNIDIEQRSINDMNIINGSFNRSS